MRNDKILNLLIYIYIYININNNVIAYMLWNSIKYFPNFYNYLHI